VNRLNKANLNTVTITKTDKDQPLLDNVHITPLGDTVGANGSAVVAVQNMQLKSGSAKMYSGDVGCTISAGTVREVLKALPNDKRFGDLLDRVEMKDEDGKIVFGFSDGIRERSIEAKKYPYGYVKYQEVFKHAYEEKTSHPAVRSGTSFIVNRKRLLSVLSALDKIAPDSSGVFPLFVDVLDDQLLIRLEHPRTKQRVVCAVHLSQTDKMLDVNEWEKGLAGSKVKQPKSKKSKGPKKKGG
jgi:hypothetical protein